MSSDTDDLPELVDSSDDDCVGDSKIQKKQSADHADHWLKKPDKFLEKQDLWMRVFCLGPFLFGVKNIVPVAWIKALITAKLLLNEKRQNSINYLEWQEWECVDLMDHVIALVQKELRNKDLLTKVLDCVKKLEDCKAGVIIDVDLAIKEAEKVTEIMDIWRSILKDEVSKDKEKAAKFAVLYVCKIYHEHVLSLSERSLDFVEDKKKTVKNNNASKQAEDEKIAGNEHFQNKKFEESVKCYTKAAGLDPFHHLYYGNRAQAYNKLKKFGDALADGRRAVTIKPDFAKGHYRYALAFYEQGRLDKAIQVNEKGLELCQQSKSQEQNIQNLEQLEQQGQKFTQERNERNQKHCLTSIPKSLKDQLSLYPTDTSNIDLTEKLGCKAPKKQSPDDDVPHLIATSESDSDTSIQPSERKVRKKTKTRKKSDPDELQTQELDMSKVHTMTIPPTTKVVNDAEAVKNTQLKEALKLREENERLEEEKKDFEAYIVDGSDSVLHGDCRGAMCSYLRALEILTHSKSKDKLVRGETEIVTLKYAFGINAVLSGIHKNIMDGITKFRDIIDNHYLVNYPSAYYGLGKAYVTLNRFPEAIQPLKDGLQVVNNVMYPRVFWPGTKEVVNDNAPDNLKKNMKELLQLCKFPPPPDAICRDHVDPTDVRTVIYLTDPDFRGYIKIVCQMDCVVTFHPICWKVFKSRRNKQNDKDILDTMCPTPDCVGFIYKVDVIRPDSLFKEHISEKYTAMKENQKNKKPMVKQKSSSTSKMAKKQEKKDLRKQKKRQRQEEIDDLTEDNEDSDCIKDGASASAFVEEIIAEAQPLPDVKNATVLKKEDLKAPKTSKSKKSRKKKDKGRQILHLEVNFTDRKEETLENENTALSDNENNPTKSKSGGGQDPFSVPSELKSQINTFEKSYTGNTRQMFKPDEITENLFSYFVDILQAHGPLAINDPKIQQELEVFPPEALDKIKQVGGLSDFLRQSLKFAVIDDVISLMSDAKRAREVALLKRGEQGMQPSAQNAWKTVGIKGMNNVDDLSESRSVVTTTSLPTIVCNTSSSFTSVTSAVISDTPAVLGNSNSSNSVSSVGNSSSSSFPSVHLLDKQWTGVNGLDSAPKTNQRKSSGIELDSIDDFTLETGSFGTSNHLDDFDTISDTGSDYKRDEAFALSKMAPRMEPVGLKPEVTMSRSSSKSDVSERSAKSELSKEMMPKPLRSFGGSGLQKGTGSGSQMWDTLENDFDVSWNDVTKEDLVNSGADLVSEEIRQATEDFVRKSDEKFVSELAQSVVEKMYKGKTVTDNDRRATLNSVSLDIWKDFEKSANAGKMGGVGLWANTPAGADYSKNIGKFATDFMKKHYEKSEGNGLSPTSNINVVFPHQPSSPLDNVYIYPNNSHFSSLNPPSWSTDDGSNEPKTSYNPSSISNPTLTTSNAGYNLFSGPSWDPFSTSVGTSFTTTTPKPILPPFIRPPLSAASYYQSGQMPPHMPPGPPGPMAMPFRPPMNPNMMPPRFPMPHPGMPMPMPYPPGFPKVETKDKESQVPAVVLKTEGTMTEVYEPYKAEYLQMKDERDQMVQLMNEHKSTCETVVLQYKANEQKVKVLEAEIDNKSSKYELEKKNWMDERESFSEKIRQLNQHIVSKDTSERELKEKMEGQEKRVNELAIMAKEQREKDLIEIRKFMDASEKYRRQAEVQMERAKSAEIEILNSRMQKHMTLLGRSQKDSLYHQQHLNGFLKKHQDDSKPVPVSLQQTLEYWTNVQEKSEETLSKIKADYQSQINEIKNGKTLSELQAICIPSPPPVPEAMKSFPFMGQPPNMGAGMPGFMMPRMPSPFPKRSPYGAFGAPQTTSPTSNGNFPVSSDSIYQTSAGAKLPGSHSTPALTTLAQPKPLTQLIGSTGLVPPRPLAGARAPLTVPGKAPLGPLKSPLRPLGMPGIQPMSSFEKLLNKLQKTFPNKSTTEFNQMIQELRQQRGGSLSGMTIEDIIGQIAGNINMKDSQSSMSQAVMPMSQLLASAKTSGPPGLSSSWAFHAAGGEKEGLTKVEELFQEEEDPCVICHEEMTSCPAVNLECGHKFHDECIRKWFQEQSTCPNCRVHTLLSDDFPSLG